MSMEYFSIFLRNRGICGFIIVCLSFFLAVMPGSTLPNVPLDTCKTIRYIKNTITGLYRKKDFHTNSTVSYLEIWLHKAISPGL